MLLKRDMTTSIFYASQLRIHIEMAFGVMVKKWGILQRPIMISIRNIKHLICAIGVLHNFSINEQSLTHGKMGIFCPKNTSFSPEETVLHNAAAEFDGANLVYDFAMARSNNREHVVQELKGMDIQGKVELEIQGMLSRLK